MIKKGVLYQKAINDIEKIEKMTYKNSVILDNIKNNIIDNNNNSIKIEASKEDILKEILKYSFINNNILKNDINELILQIGTFIHKFLYIGNVFINKSIKDEMLIMIYNLNHINYKNLLLIKCF